MVTPPSAACSSMSEHSALAGLPTGPNPACHVLELAAQQLLWEPLKGALDSLATFPVLFGYGHGYRLRHSQGLPLSYPCTVVHGKRTVCATEDALVGTFSPKVDIPLSGRVSRQQVPTSTRSKSPHAGTASPLGHYQTKRNGPQQLL